MLILLSCLVKRIKFQNSKILENILKSSFANVDETSVKVNGKIYWVFVIRHCENIYFRLYEHRGDCGKGILDNYTGVLIHDHWRAYYKYAKCKHAECNIHTNRELNGLLTLDKIAQAGELKKFMISILHERNQLIMNGVFYFTAERIKEIEEKYVELVTNLSLYFKDYDDIERICAKKRNKI